MRFLLLTLGYHACPLVPVHSGGDITVHCLCVTWWEQVTSASALTSQAQGRRWAWPLRRPQDSGVWLSDKHLQRELQGLGARPSATAQQQEQGTVSGLTEGPQLPPGGNTAPDRATIPCGPMRLPSPGSVQGGLTGCYTAWLGFLVAVTGNVAAPYSPHEGRPSGSWGPMSPCPDVLSSRGPPEVPPQTPASPTSGLASVWR